MLSTDSTDRKAWLTFSTNVSMAIIMVILGIFIGLFLNNKRLVETGLQVRAQAHFDNIILARRWNAGYGGVFVEKKPGVVSNPYLKNPDIRTVEGKTYTKKNPALMLREISALAEKDHNGAYRFHITSLNPLNPDNAPDEFEQTALASFEKGAKEASTKQRQDGTLYYRYMAPLVVEESCLQCHAEQGYKLGDIKGGISVSFDMMDVQQELDRNRSILASLFILTVSLLLGTIYLLIKHLMMRLAVVQAKMAEMAVTDDLTQLYNRRYFFSKLQEELSRAKRHQYPISCLLIDVDFFKKVNDTHGHLYGDSVLREIAQLLKTNCRVSDTVARYGGEEFIQFLPETGAEGAAFLAEKLRSLIENHTIQADAILKLRVTVSIGVVSLTSEEIERIDRVDQIIQLADQALYKAKRNGRNRFEFC